MSALTNQISLVESQSERRFYPRVAPSTPIQISITPAHPVTVVNISENGLLAASQTPLEANSVHRISPCFAGFARAISVHAHIVWVEASSGLAGIQFLDLNDDDRLLVREWINAQLAHASANPEPHPALDPELPELLGTPVAPTTISANQQNAQSDPALAYRMFGNISTPGKDGETPQPHSALLLEPESRRTASPLIFWISALAVICLAGVWAFANNLADSSQAAPVRVHASRSSAAKRSPASVDPAPATSSPSQAIADQTSDVSQSPAHSIAASVPTGSAPSPAPAGAPTVSSVANSAAADASEKDSPLSRTGQPSPRNVTEHAHPMVAARDTPVTTASRRDTVASPSEINNPSSSSPSTAPVTSTPAPATTVANSGSSPSLPKVPARDSVATSHSLDAMPRTLSVDTIPRKSVFTNQFPDVNRNSPTSNSQPNNSARATSSSPSPNNRDLQSAGYLSDTATSNVPSLRASPSSAHSSQVVPTGSTAPGVNAGVNANSDLARPNTTAPPTSTSSPNSASEPRVVELNPSSRDSYVYLPGERVIQAPSITMRIQRSVWVRGGHWFWHGRKKVSLGQLSTRIDPQMPRNARYGSITVQATVDKDGRVDSVRPLYGSAAFLLSVSKAIRGWHFEPTYVDSRPVETQAKIEIDFHAISANAQHP